MRGTYLCVVVVVAFTAGRTLHGGDGKDLGAADLKKLQGTWQFTAQEMDGKPRPAEQLIKLKITFTDDKWSVADDGKVIQAGTHKLDPTKKPAQVDALVKEGQDKGNTMLGIYELKGNKMRVCFDPQGKERPTGFSAKAGQFSAVIERDKKK
jgi:uncharacterized protein (TIGR03067 family)